MFTYAPLFSEVLNIANPLTIDFREPRRLQLIHQHMALEGSQANSSEVMLAPVQLHWTA